MLNLLLDLDPREPDLGQADQWVEGLFFLLLRRLPLDPFQLLLQRLQPTRQLEAGARRLLGEADDVLFQLSELFRREAVANLVGGRTHQRAKPIDLQWPDEALAKAFGNAGQPHPVLLA